jgi:hypothetical protein
MAAAGVSMTEDVGKCRGRDAVELRRPPVSGVTTIV